ncbi:2-oxoacid:acceptor oxidoreductase subunit alpha [Dehalobacterium formicoaceticum]|uniref:2-oxoacid:acceptor oxidoreductase subunit alpha n=1 Tax=Dehalobacterium formicoaceticum TaxID=51515 RepID=A0ABT1Y0V7_9FIRM|nr:2-oxoacid:acceptor oxidoreductase subunit alpha [Dehalobacterium formicoaceticum]MCR6544492.1 2-oxoacid:acceptor oxidoreductase subunit alpha [Dehalobacterium formicoaceticum]
MEYSILVGGAAGQGIETLAGALEKIIKAKGFHLFSTKDYMSRVRGGHNFTQIRFSDSPLTGYWPELDIILAFDAETLKLHSDRLKEGGYIICDEKLAGEKPGLLGLPLEKSAKELGNPRVAGTIAMGAVAKLLGFSTDGLEQVFQKEYKEKIREINIKAFHEGYQMMTPHFDCGPEKEDRQILISGNQALALGALAGGVAFYSGYPMTPSTSIMTYLSEKQAETGIVVEQAEDEIAAINMAIGASYAGVRAMTATSGGGFSLMTEALGLAGITETPLVVINSMRPGPATGFPTRTEQGDLSFILSAGHGEIPRMVISVKNPEDGFYQIQRALNLADKYQLLVIVLSDQFFGDSSRTCLPFDFDSLKIERYLQKDLPEDHEHHLRYRLTENGISPRVIPGKFPGVTVLADSDEHDERGNITESAEMRIAMMEKRMNKLKLLQEELQEPEYLGVENPQYLCIAWGSTQGPVQEAIEILNKEGIAIGALVFGDIWPLPLKNLEKYAAHAEKIINIEQNYLGQMARLIRQETGIKCTDSILKYDGRPFNAYEIVQRLKKEVF